MGKVLRNVREGKEFPRTVPQEARGPRAGRPTRAVPSAVGGGGGAFIFDGIVGDLPG